MIFQVGEDGCGKFVSREMIDLVENMVWDRTSFHGFIYGVEYEEYVDEEKSVEHCNLEK